MNTPTLEVKQGSAWTNDSGESFPAAPLYRFVSDDDRRGCFYAKVENAARSWNRRHPERQVSAS